MALLAIAHQRSIEDRDNSKHDIKTDVTLQLDRQNPFLADVAIDNLAHRSYKSKKPIGSSFQLNLPSSSKRFSKSLTFWIELNLYMV